MRGLELNPDDPTACSASPTWRTGTEWRLTPEERRLDREEADWRGNPWNSFKPTQRAQVDVGTLRDMPILGFHRPDQPSPTSITAGAAGGPTCASRYPTHPYLPLTLASPYACRPPPSDRPAAPRVGQHRQRSAHPFGRTHGLGRLHDSPPIRCRRAWQDLTLTITSPTRRPADLQPDSSDERNLGVGVERVFSKLTLSQIRDPSPCGRGDGGEG